MKRCMASRWQKSPLVFAGLAVLLTVSSCQRAPEPPTFYRFDDNLGEASVTAAVHPQDSKAGARFEFEGVEERLWTSAKGTSICKAADGVLTFEAKEGDFLLSPDNLQVQGGEIEYILIGMVASSPEPVVLWWRYLDQKWSEQKYQRLRIHVPRVGEPFTYRIETRSARMWRPREVSQLRLQVPRGARVDIDFIRCLTSSARFSKESAGTTEYAIDKQSRSCLYTHCPSKIVYEVPVPERAYICTGMGIIDPTHAVNFSITAKRGRESETLLRQEVDSGEKWHDAKIDLAKYANRKVELTFTTDCDDPRQIALWSNPVLWQSQGGTQQRADGPGTGSPERRGVNVLLYIIDAMRADHLDVYGYHRETAPTMARLAEEGVRFTRCFSQETWTKPSMSALFTGVPRPVHGVMEFGDIVPDGLVMLPKVLRRHGYVTAAISENAHTPPDANPRGDYSYAERPTQHVPRGPARLGSAELSEATATLAAAFLEKHQDRNFFLYVHTLEPHDPYVPPQEYAGLYTSSPGEDPTNLDIYDAEIRWSDDNLQRLISKLEELRIYDNTVLILTADHGEAFEEHEGMTKHGGKPYNELLHVPLIMRCPGILPAGLVFNENVQMIDITTTILELLGAPPENQFQGESLLSLILNGDSEAFTGRTVYCYGRGIRAAIDGDWKAIYDTVTRQVELYDLRSDFGETRNLALENESVLESIMRTMSKYLVEQEKLGAQLVKGQESAAVRIDKDKIEQLEDLGYLQ